MTERLDVVCGTRAGRDMHLDIYPPTGSTNHRTALLVFHGGGFRQGDRKMQQPQCRELAARGFTAIAVEYRLIDDTNVAWPDPLHDVKAAIAWTSAHADDLGIDADRIVLQGHSAGAMLSLMAAGTVGSADFRPPFELEAPETKVAAVLAYYPAVQFVLRAMPTIPTDGPPSPEVMAEMARAMLSDDGTMPASILLGDEATERQAAAASPINYVTEAFPPTLIFHGTADTVVSSPASTTLYKALRAAGVATELHILAGAYHGFDSVPSLFGPAAALTESFLGRMIIDPSGFAEEEATHNPLAAMQVAMAALQSAS